jgi:succinate dehydrogenase/fumarate reductase cytochrome b subunit
VHINTVIKRFHRLSGIVVASFLLLHITNHLFALGGPQLHIAVTNLFRYVYRSLLVEIVLLMCVIFQIISGILLVFRKGFLKQPLYVVVQIISGLYLSFFMIYHVRAVMLARYAWNVNTDFYFAANVANRYPEKLFFIPYYTLSLVCVFAHIACAHYIKRMEKLGKISDSARNEVLHKKYKKEGVAICITGAIVTFLIMISISGVLYDIIT